MGGARWRLPGFVIGELLGSGNSSEVWAARIAATGERVALKRVALTEPDALRAARTEAALLTALDHPHLIRLHALIPTPDAAVLVLDLADGGSLADLLARRGRLAVGEVVTALAPIGAALAYAHQHGVLHGDVTPGNVLFTAIGLPMLADLGVGRIVGDSVAVRCTPEYIDPAVARGCAPGPSSDVFMLGAVAMRALTGSPVWRGTTTAEILADAAAGDLGHLPERFAVLPPPVAAVLEQALVAEPHLRCTAAEFALDLRHSAVPMPVELSAGRRPERSPGVGRDAAGRVLASPREPRRASSRGPAPALAAPAVTDPGRPAFRPSRSGSGNARARRRADPSRQGAGPADLAAATRTPPPIARSGVVRAVGASFAPPSGHRARRRRYRARRRAAVVRSAQPSGRGPPAYVRRAICAERLDALGQLVVARRRLAPAGRPSRASLCSPRRRATRAGVRSRTLVGRGRSPAAAARARRMWVGRRSYRIPQRSSVSPGRRTVECPRDGTARAVDLALQRCRQWSRGRRWADRTAY